MRIRILALLLAAIAALAPLPAKAKLMFGNDETIHFIQDVTATGAQGEKLYLGYKITKTFLFAGIWLQDDGYVLGVKGEGRRYYTMPKNDELKRLQAGGFLPTPLPGYRIGFFEYLFGYSLWLIAAGFAVFYLGKRLLRRDTSARQIGA